MRPLDYDAICQSIRAALGTARIHAISLHDEKGDVLWMTESSMGPDEHNAVREAFEVFSNPDGRPVTAFDLGDSRSAVLFRAVNAGRALVGAIMTILDSRGIRNDDASLRQLMTPKMRNALIEFAGMRPAGTIPSRAAAPKAAPPRAAAPAAAAPQKHDPDAPFELTLADSMRIAKPAMPPGEPVQAAAPRRAPISPTASSPMSVRSAPPDPAARAGGRADRDGRTENRAGPGVTLASAGPSTVPRRSPAGAPPPGRTATAPGSGLRPLRAPPDLHHLHSSLRRSPIALSVQRLVPLTKGTELDRYEVLLRSSAEGAPNAAPHAMLKAAVDNGLGSMVDRRVLTDLIAWLARHPDAWKNRASMFSVNLTSTALLDEHFIRFVGLCLAKSSLPPAMIAFEIDAATAMKLGAKVADVAGALHGLGCPLVLDDFGMRTECFDLLRLPGVRYVKLASQITQKMRSDKMSQAAITAVVQMARVLGMHTVAKRTETAAEHEWLTALGVDFVQSNALSPAASIDTLIHAARPAG
jgi:EAL domain-containing protein (putative c-di-GMP-specific phosphodiesterase class I)